MDQAVTTNPYLNRNLLNKWREQSKRVESLLASPATVGAALHPITYARVKLNLGDEYKGYLASQDGRIILRFVDDLEADAKFGVRGATTEECLGLIFRLGNLKEVEDAALDSQRDAVQLRKALSILVGYLSRGETPPQRAVSEAVIVLRRVEGA